MGFRDATIRSLAGGPQTVSDDEIAAATRDVRSTVPEAVLAAGPARASAQGGERQDYRDGMDRMTGQLVEAGNSPQKAREIARAAAIRHDRQNGVRTR
jgi:soluble cytochrome b562